MNQLMHHLVGRLLRGGHRLLWAFRSRPALTTAVVVIGLLLAEAAEARVGGGSSYSGSRRSSGGGGGGGGGGGSGDLIGLLFHLIFSVLPWPLKLVLVVIIIVFLIKAKNRGPSTSYGDDDADDDDSRHRPAAPVMRRSTRFHAQLPPSWAAAGRAIDAGFSEVLFLERTVLLVTRAFEAGPKPADLEALSPYLSPSVAHILATRSQGVAVVRGVTIGSIGIVDVDKADVDGVAMIAVRVRLHLNRHVEHGTKPASFYSHEEWTLSRPVGAPAVVEDTIARFGCPGCGSALERDAQGRCVHCATSLVPGAADWTVRSLRVLDEEARGPLLTQNVEELGTHAPTAKDDSVENDAMALLGEAETTRLVKRAREIFENLQGAWSTRDTNGLRPWETDALFGSHRFWIEEYQRQQLRNVVDQLYIRQVELCRVERDGAHLSATCRIHATCLDYTMDDKANKQVAGSLVERRAFTEYWTFVKHADAKGSASLKNCPSCGAPLNISQTGVCEYCQSKVTLGAFDWVASRIEQDEEIVPD